MFQHTAARRRLPAQSYHGNLYFDVSTHSRPKAAAEQVNQSLKDTIVSTHSRPKAAAIIGVPTIPYKIVSTHSRPKAAAATKITLFSIFLSFNTQPPEGGCFVRGVCSKYQYEFQHTAARRRLLPPLILSVTFWTVSTHSRPKAAAPYIKKQEKSVY